MSIPVENSSLFRLKIPPRLGGVSLQFAAGDGTWSRLVKRRRALVETNPPRNIQLQTHRDDGIGGGAEDCFASVWSGAHIRAIDLLMP